MEGYIPDNGKSIWIVSFDGNDEIKLLDLLGDVPEGHVDSATVMSDGTLAVVGHFNGEGSVAQFPIHINRTVSFFLAPFPERMLYLVHLFARNLFRNGFVAFLDILGGSAVAATFSGDVW